MGASIIVFIFAFMGTAAAVGSAVMTLLLSNKVKELRDIADNQNLTQLEQDLGTGQILAWTAAALGLITAIIFVVLKNSTWFKVIGTLLTLAALIASIVLQSIALGAIDRLGPTERDELRGYATWAITFNAIAMAFFILSLSYSLIFTEKPPEDIYKEGEYAGGVFAPQTADELSF